MKKERAIGRVAISLSVSPSEFIPRLFLAFVVGYFFSMEISASLGLLLSIVLERSEAAVLSAMISFLVYMLVIICVTAGQNLFRLWIILPNFTIFCYLVNTRVIF